MFLLILTGCTVTSERDEAAKNEPDKIKVVASIFPLADITREIGGERVEVVTLLPSGASPHTFEVTPGQMKELSNARVLIQVGAGLDDWATKAVEAANSEIKVVKVTEGIELLKYEHHHHDGDAAPHEEHHHDGDEAHQEGQHEGDAEDRPHHEVEEEHHHAGDPHVWTDPILVRDNIVPAITEALCRVDPEGSDVYQEHMRAYQEKLTELHDEINDKVSQFANSRFIAYHSAWNYFARRYGLEEAAVIQEAPGKEPTPTWIAKVVDLAHQTGVKVIFAEPQFNDQAARVIAAEFGGQVVQLDPLGGAGLEGRDSYVSLIRYNLAKMKEAFSGPKV
ncbi:MAG: zinc ABC transporter substrate-binding protein [Peptococcaceae bacterium]|nr:zinc ABC transporter substrate-binding protein [Peptococcaceae bacterium]